MSKIPIVEVAVTDANGERVPLGIMNTQQALSIPENVELEVSHPAEEAGRTDVYITREELRKTQQNEAVGEV